MKFKDMKLIVEKNDFVINGINVIAIEQRSIYSSGTTVVLNFEDINTKELFTEFLNVNMKLIERKKKGKKSGYSSRALGRTKILLMEKEFRKRIDNKKPTKLKEETNYYEDFQIRFK